MRRWFRRKGKDNDRDDDNGTTPLGEEIEPSPRRQASPPNPSPRPKQPKQRNSLKQ
jgi:hypothetical protein